MCEGSNVKAVLSYDQIPIIQEISEYIHSGAFPGGTFRNWDSYGDKVGPVSEVQKMILCDPQTSGGLLVALDPEGEEEFMKLMKQNGFKLLSIGYLKEQDGGAIVDII